MEADNQDSFQNVSFREILPHSLSAEEGCSCKRFVSSYKLADQRETWMTSDSQQNECVNTFVLLQII